MHAPNIYKGHNTKDPKHWEWLQQSHGKPVYMQAVDPLIPDSVEYPLSDAKALCGVDMFPTSFAYMAALAIMQGYDEIRIYGIELSSSEYAYQANGYLFWFGFLIGRLGVDNVDTAVKYLDKSIFTVPYYGYEGGFSFTQEYFAERIKTLKSEYKASDKSLKNIRDVLLKAIERNDFEKVQKLTLDYQGAAMLHGEHAGALQEAERYHTFGDRDADRGGFEFQAASAQQRVEEQKPYVWHLGGMIEYAWNGWKQSDGKHGGEQVKGFVSAMGERAFKLGGDMGILSENVRYVNQYDKTMEANGVVHA